MLREEVFEARLQIRIRGARKEDLPSLEWWGWYGNHRDLIQSVYEETLRGESVMIVAESGGFPVGQAWVDLRIEPDRHGAMIWAVRVIPGFRNAGIGARLISAAEDYLRSSGHKLCEIGVEKENRDALRLYERMGYQLASERSEQLILTKGLA